MELPNHFRKGDGSRENTCNFDRIMVYWAKLWDIVDREKRISAFILFPAEKEWALTTERG